MKALILCAGLGTRLLPHTRRIPKPLFPIGGIPLLDWTIQSLVRAGCQSIMLNTHHLHHQIEAWIAGRRYPIPVQCCFEPHILGTGGAVKNVEDFWDDRPSMVINGDIATDIDFHEVYSFHCRHPHPVTVVLHDFPEINTVAVDSSLSVLNIDNTASSPSGNDLHDAAARWTFTGIQVLDAELLQWIPESVEYSIIDLYRMLMRQGRTIQAYIPQNAYWMDIGIPSQYQTAVMDYLTPRAFREAFPDETPESVCTAVPIAGDGSDRLWSRISTPRHSLIAANHGIHSQPDVRCELDAFVTIGRHLLKQGITVPRIYMADSFSGWAFVEDLGDIHLQSLILNSRSSHEILHWYQSAIRLLVSLSVLGMRDFDLSLTFQTPVYDKALILERECRYFVDAFLMRYLNLNVCYENLETEFNHLADCALSETVDGFMHRDFQSRNLMVKDGQIYAIDFQGGRKGPIQYDLASLLIDPYTHLSQNLQDMLVEFCIQELSNWIPVDRSAFVRCYQYCRITRNLQILGAFGFLTQVKGKLNFKSYIPAAVQTLNISLSQFPPSEFPQLTRIIQIIDIDKS